MKRRIIFNDNGVSSTVASDGSLYEFVPKTVVRPVLVPVKKSLVFSAPVNPGNAEEGLKQMSQDYTEYEMGEEEVVTTEKVLRDDPDIYDVEPSSTGKYIKEDGVVRPMTSQEVFDRLPAVAKRETEYRSYGDIFDAFMDSVEASPELTALFDNSKFADQLSFRRSVKEKYPKA